MQFQFPLEFKFNANPIQFKSLHIQLKVFPIQIQFNPTPFQVVNQIPSYFDINPMKIQHNFILNESASKSNSIQSIKIQSNAAPIQSKSNINLIKTQSNSNPNYIQNKSNPKPILIQFVLISYLIQIKSNPNLAQLQIKSKHIQSKFYLNPINIQSNPN